MDAVVADCPRAAAVESTRLQTTRAATLRTGTLASFRNVT
jgi:hypothetical protein